MTVKADYSVDGLNIDVVKDRYDLVDTPTGKPKKIRCAYIDWRGSNNYGAIMTKRDLKRLRKWCDEQIKHYDDEDKDVIY